MAAIFPAHDTFSHQIKVAKTALLALESFASAVLAFAYAAVQSPSPGATSTGMAKARREILVTSC
jgi:3D (Asp-Asp-Asp) domain-containing protein